ncbi:D-alanyl-D-alanine carboxypeptidase [Fructilactobacillus florum 8D]|uniref:D-alanyl-D-alanine carboxypeptidase n=2 Tax=Fructilactobacillus florum TaxID=640331 RepID=W9EEE2_9LACO|nr:serine hydrolase [Fructilactobacillus florum]ETO40483.1 D-alanyl-D-alanine carboxypeptidase [Fructilactobacillus florum 8D]KRM91333.1 d-alanyl-d-alanine carboxypeptidase [Fructilactobacillus florum DSM 22689 = JCM 16035]
MIALVFIKKFSLTHVFICLLTTIVAISTTNVIISHAQPANPVLAQDASITAKSALAIDATSGQIIYQKVPDHLVPIASLSKLVTTYIVLNEIQHQHLHWDTPVKISPAEAQLSQNTNFTNVPLQAGKSYPVRDLLNASLICSANAAAMALGNRIAGNSNNFAKLMQRTTQKLGIKDAKLYNACGLNNQELGSLSNPKLKPTTTNQMSATGMAILSQQLIKKYPQVLQITNQPQLHWETQNYQNTNKLIGSSQPFKIDGLKTGTNATGESLVSTGAQKQTRIITVILDAPKGERFSQTERLLQQIKQKLQPHSASRNALPTKSINIPNGKKTTTAIKPAESKTYWLPVGDKLKTDFVTNEHGKIFQTPLAPILKNQIIGKLLIKNQPPFPLLPHNQLTTNVVFVTSNPVNISKMLLGFLELLLLVCLLGWLLYQFWKYRHRHLNRS